MKDRGWTHADVPRLDGRRFIVTGANSGLGLETSRILLRQGATVVLACRDQSRADAAAESLRPMGGPDRVLVSLLDLGDLASIDAFAKREMDEKQPLHVLVCNAGLMAIPERKTADGFEMTMGVNHLGHFALVGKLLTKITASGTGRIVSTSSNYHKLGRLDLMEDVLGERRPYNRWTVYHQSKLANLLFAFELGRRLERSGSTVISVAAHPGYTATELQSHGSKMGAPVWEGWGMAIGNALFAQSVRMGAMPQLRAATDPTAKNGDYFGPRGVGELRGPAVRVEPARRARNESAARLLWERSEELTKERYQSGVWRRNQTS